MNACCLIIALSAVGSILVFFALRAVAAALGGWEDR
jgi:hypothetical protein